MNLFKYLRWFIFVIPLGFLLLSFFYKDSSYVVFAVIAFLLGVLIALPNIFANQLFLKLDYKKLFPKQSKRQRKTSEKIEKIPINKKIIFLIASVVIFTVFFTFVGAYVLPTIAKVHNLILEYYVSQLLDIRNTWFYLIILFIAVVLIASSIEFNKKDRSIEFEFQKNLLISNLKLSSISLVAAFILSFVSLYLFAIFQMNAAVVTLENTPNSVGVLYGKSSINSKLKLMTTVPQVIGSESNVANTVLSTVVVGSTRSNSYYQARIIKSVPSFLVIPFSINNQSVIMVNTTLIITSIDKDAMQTLSPTIAKLLLKNYFKDRNLKGDPTITILNRQEYLAFRQGEINQQEAKIQSAIQKVNAYLNSMQSDAYSTQQKINNDQSIVDNASSQETSAYNNCMSYGYTDFYTGQFVPYYTQSYCSSLQSQWAQVVSQGNQDISQLNSELQYDNGQITEAQNAVQALQTYMQDVDAEKSATPDELGIFEGPSHVRVVLDSTSPKGIDEFLETLVHENLHYQSYVSQDRQFQFSDGSYDSFWEEGLTEYFARKVIAADLGVNVNQGYPLIVKIVAQIARKIPESELQRVYFTKDEAGLESDLDTAYGNNFYKDSELYFETLSFLPADQQLKTANNIMTRIGGQQLTANDLYSTDLQQE